MKVFTKEKQSSYYTKLSDKEKAEYAAKRNWHAKATDEQKKAFAAKMKSISDARTPEQIAEENRKNSEGLKKYWANATDEQRAKHIDPWKAGNARYWANMTPEERSKKASDTYWNMPEERRKELHDIYSANISKYNASLSMQEKVERAKAMQKWHESLTADEKHELYLRTHQWYYDLPEEEKEKYAEDKKKWYDNLLDQDKKKHRRKALTAPQGKNMLHQKFENMFMNSHLVNSFVFRAEDVQINSTTHSWDYGIYDENHELVMLVDIDGEYFHADDRDYDGIHSKEEYDESRSLSVPDNVKICIIQESNFTKSFGMMIKMLMQDYDEYVESMFQMCRAMPFPEPNYSDRDLYKSFESIQKMNCDDKYHKDISLNTRIGDRLIQHFHPSIYRAHRRGAISPYEAWHDDKRLKDCIRNRIIYQTYLNPQKILQGFNISRIAPKISVFSAGRARMIINKYLNNFNTIFDPFSGFSGRMLGAVSLGKRYIGQDISDIHINESNNLIKFLIPFKIEAEVQQANVLESTGEYPCLFTCPPYSDKEQWVDVQVDQRSCDDWIDVCLERFKCRRYVFVVDNTERYKNYVVDIIVNRSALNLNYEYIICIDK